MVARAFTGVLGTASRYMVLRSWDAAVFYAIARSLCSFSIALLWFCVCAQFVLCGVCGQTRPVLEGTGYCFDFGTLFIAGVATLTVNA